MRLGGAGAVVVACIRWIAALLQIHGSTWDIYIYTYVYALYIHIYTSVGLDAGILGFNGAV